MPATCIYNQGRAITVNRHCGGWAYGSRHFCLRAVVHGASAISRLRGSRASSMRSWQGIWWFLKRLRRSSTRVYTSLTVLKRSPRARRCVNCDWKKNDKNTVGNNLEGESTLGAGNHPAVNVQVLDSYLVDPASSHMLVSKIKPCMSKYSSRIVKPRMAH